MTHFQFVYTLFWLCEGIHNIDKINVITSGWFVYGHINECVVDMGGINGTLMFGNLVFGGNWYKWGSIKFDRFAKVRFV